MKTALEETLFSFAREAPAKPERRRDQRHVTILKVGSLFIDGRRELCLIRNISAGGLMVHVYSDIEPGAPLEIELQEGRRVAGVATWVEEGNVGIQADQPIDVAAMLACPSNAGTSQRPRRPRIEVDRLATIRIGAFTYGANTRDISQGGVKLEIDRPIEPGTEIVLTLERFRPVHGVVRWCHDGECGVEFNQLIPLPDLVQWLSDPDDKAN